MTNLLKRALGGGKRNITTLDDYAQAVASFQFQGNTYPIQQSYGHPSQASLVGCSPNFESFASQLYASNGPIFSLISKRQMAFSAVRMMWQQYEKGRPTELFGTPALKVLEEPWPGGTLSDLLAEMILDVDLAGNTYWTMHNNQFVRLRPDWVDIVLGERSVAVPTANGTNRGVLSHELVGYLYWEGGRGQAKDPIPFLPDEVCHWAPIKDPLAQYRGMSWLTPLIREIGSDRLMNEHKAKFFQHGATPNMIIKHDPGVSIEDAKRFKAMFEAEYGGTANAYKTMHLGGGADATVVGSDLKSLDFAMIQTHGETRMASAAGVPPIVAGFSEGLLAGTYSNYKLAVRHFAGFTLHPLWNNACGALQNLIKPPPGARLYYDIRDVEFLRDDSMDLSELQQTQAATISSLIAAGFTPESAVKAVRDNELANLKHTGLVSVQLWVPGENESTTEKEGGESGSDDSSGTDKKGDGGEQPDATPPQEQGVYG